MAKYVPKVYYGLHFCPGVAEYREAGKEPRRIFLNEDTIRKMNPTFQGRPVYVQHVDEVDMQNLQEEMDGVVVRSFFNAADGKTWVEFLAISDEAHEKIAQGWRLSNAYLPKKFGPGGQWNGVDYQDEVLDADYEHLAIVNNPRYDESIILDAEQFRAYNETKKAELLRIANSKGDKMGKFNFFKRTKVENGADFDGMLVTLPKSKKEVSLESIIEQADAIQNMDGYANGEHMVKVGEEEMSVNALVKAHMKLKKNMDEAAAEDKKENDDEDGDGEKKENDEGDVDGEPEMKANEDEEELEKEELEKGDKKKNKKKNSADLTDEEKAEAAEKAKKKKENFDSINNAGDSAPKDKIVLDLPRSQVERGKNRYGSGK